MNKFSKSIRSQKGSSMILVLAVIFILSSLGAIALFAGLTNVSMGSRYRNWSREYYALDMQAEQKVKYIDQNVMKPGEDKAQQYMRNEYYLKAYSDPDLPEDVKSIIPEALQTLLNNKWSTVDSAAALNTYIKEAFRLIYYYYAASYMSAVSDADSSITHSTNISINYDSINWEDYNIGINFYITVGDGEGRKVDVAGEIMEPHYQPVTLIKHTPYYGNPIWTNAVAAGKSIYFNGTGTTTIYGDLYSSSDDESYPIPEGGSKGIVSNGAAVVVNGNVYSKGDVHVRKSNGSITVNTYDTIASDTPDITMKNKIFGDNDLLFENRGLYVNNISAYTEGTSSGNIPYIFKDINGGNVYCNNLSIEERDDHGFSVNNARITVKGSVWTYDDIQMDGINSTITVEKNFIGLTSGSDNENKNYSSAVINNQPASSKINLRGGIIAPGTAHVQFDTGEEGRYVYYQTAESVTAKQQDLFAAYSDVPPSGSYGVDYTYDWFNKRAGPATHIFYLLRFGELTNPGAGTQDLLDRKIGYFLNHIVGKQIKTGIYSSSSVAGYALGGVGMHNTEDAPYAAFYSMNDISNRNAFTTIRDTLIQIMKYKTQNMGTSDKTMDSLINSAAISGTVGDIKKLNQVSNQLNTNDTNRGFIYSAGSLTITGGENFSGIIFSEGDITVNTNAKFDGTIISKGNIIITGNPEIRYCEAVIKGLMNPVIDTPQAESIRAFFSPEGLKMGKPVFHVVGTTISTNSAQRSTSIKKRYRITQWVEGR